MSGDIIYFGNIWSIIVPYIDNFDDILTLLQAIDDSKYVLNSEILACFYPQHDIELRKYLNKFTKLRHIDLSCSNHYNNIYIAGHRVLDKLKNVHKLHLGYLHNALAPLSACELGYLSNIYELNMGQVEINNNILKKIMNNDNPKLHTLHLGYCNDKVTNEGLKYLSDIKALHINDNRNITDDGLQYLKNIEIFEQGTDSSITNDGLKYLTNVHTLILNRNSKISAIGLKQLEKLQTLQLGYCSHFTDDDMKYLTNIYELDLGSNSKITDDGLIYLSNVRILVLGHISLITDKGLKYLSNIYELNIGTESKITDDGLKYLTNLRKLTIGSIHNITNKGFKYLTDNNVIIEIHNRDFDL